MIYTGDSAIDFLATRVVEDDPAASSHWKKYHSGFAFTGDGFSGLQGFGGLSEPTPARNAWHWLMQVPFRRMGAGFAEFSRLNKLGRKIAMRQRRVYDLDMMRQAISLAFMKDRLDGQPDSNSTVCVIGDGFGSMTALLVQSRSARVVLLVNLTRTLLVDLWYLKLALGEGFQQQVYLATEGAGVSELVAELRSRGGRETYVVALQATDHSLLRSCAIDVAINIVSMQEMDPPIIAEYFGDLRAPSDAHQEGPFFYCCNREEKTLPDGTITRILEYPWEAGDRILEDELCPWHQRYYSRRPNFYHPYDGPIRHRLVRLAQGEI